MTGKIAFIWRGDCEFGAKSLAAQNAGAIAILIVNHSAGGPVGMGAGAVGSQVTIPVFMISLEQGTPINDLLRNGATVKVSFTTWGSGKTNDLAILPNGIATWHAGAVPVSQLAGSTSPMPYKGYDGAYMANFGTADETNVMLKSVLTWNPTSGSAQTIRRDSISFASFPKADSIVAIGMANSYDVNASTTGRFDLNYSLSSASTDEFTANNIASHSFYVTPDVFVKGRYNAAKNEPIANSFWRLGSAEFTMGNLFYVTTSNWAAISSLFSLSKTGTDVLDGSTATLMVYKWTDGPNFTDSLIQASELAPVAIGSVTFGINDSTGKMYMVNYAAADGTPGINGLMLDANSWYWVAAVVPADCFLGMDGIVNQLPRTYLRAHAPTNPFVEFYTSQRTGTHIEIADDSLNNPGLTSTMFAFEAGTVVPMDAVDSARFAQQKNGFVPAISLRIAQTLGITNTNSNTAEIYLYPNPASEVVNAKIRLKETAKKVTYNLISITGKSHQLIVHSNVMEEEVSFSTAGLAAGTYFIVINADNKSTTVKKFAVIR
jgi:hypothetical protein